MNTGVFGRLFSGSGRRRDRARAMARGPLADFYDADWPDPSTPATELKLLAIDLETTGLNAETDQALSVGYVPLDGPAIVLAGARHLLIRPEASGGENKMGSHASVQTSFPEGASAQSTETHSAVGHSAVGQSAVGQSAVLHHITDDMVAAGLRMDEVLTETLAALKGRILLAHYASIEEQFLSRACEKHFGAPLVAPVIDTLALHSRLLSQGFDDEARGDQLRLWNARQRYGLPTYGAHEALTDALACAELFLAQVSELSVRAPQTLKSLRR